MSVHHRRFAAAKRTAAHQSGSRSRLKLTMTWLTIATALSLFTFTVGAGAVSSTKPDYAGAAKELKEPGPNEHRVIIESKSHKKEVCSVNQSQYELLETQYVTGHLIVTVDGSPVDLVTVEGAKDHDLHALLGDMTCELVKEKHVFYLPFDAQTS
jgi:hypothetical protein